MTNKRLEALQQNKIENKFVKLFKKHISLYDLVSVEEDILEDMRELFTIDFFMKYDYDITTARKLSSFLQYDMSL
jgi:arsenate reductase-like glutaredoxin family protein